jgi:hypothetical protein
MKASLSQALDNVEMTYQEINEIINDILNPVFYPINQIIDEINLNVSSMSVDLLRDYILRLQLKGFEISEMKEKSSLKAELAEAIAKERFAEKFNLADGSAAAKDKVATIATSEETITEALYSGVANLLKIKLDSVYRMVDSLKSILMSKMQELKISSINIGATNEIP